MLLSRNFCQISVCVNSRNFQNCGVEIPGSCCYDFFLKNFVKTISKSNSRNVLKWQKINDLSTCTVHRFQGIFLKCVSSKFDFLHKFFIKISLLVRNTWKIRTLLRFFFTFKTFSLVCKFATSSIASQHQLCSITLTLQIKYFHSSKAHTRNASYLNKKVTFLNDILS